MFDFSKAFDKVPHHLLLCKLRKIGFSITSLKWIHSYLSERTQAVIDECGNVSPWLSTNLGVPQDSVLGPLLFSLFINDISDSIKFSSHMTFADDVQIYRSCAPNDLQHSLACINQDVNSIYEYSLANELSLSLPKSKVLILGSNARIRELDLRNLPAILVGGVPLPYVSEHRNLGLVIPSSLSWKRHVACISRDVHGLLHKLKYHRNSLPTDVRAKLISTLIFPRLDYCSIVFCNLPSTLDCKLQRLVNSCIRFVFDLRRDSHVTAFRHQLGWLSVKNRRLYFLAILVYKVLNQKVPTYIAELFYHVDPDIRTSQRRPQSTFTIPFARTNVYMHSVSVSACRLWHSLPACIATSSSLAVFKLRLYQHLRDSELANV